MYEVGASNEDGPVINEVSNVEGCAIDDVGNREGCVVGLCVTGRVQSGEIMGRGVWLRIMGRVCDGYRE